MRAITEKTQVPLSLIVTLVTFICGATWWAASMQTRVSRNEEATQEIVKELKLANDTLIELKVILKQDSRR